MGGCLSTPEPNNQLADASTSLLGEKAPSYHVPAPPSRREAKKAHKAPAFKTLAAAAAPAAAPSSAGASFIFCRCGGAGSLVALLPCNHAALCMMCAQRERVCPECLVVFTDSRPSFKAKR